MLTVRTYYVGLSKDQPTGPAGGLVKRMNNLTGVWTNVSLPLSLPNANVDLFDVETDPNNGDKVFVVGKASYVNGYFGIYVSTNGGLNWIIPGGNYQTIIGTNLVQWNEVTVVDSNTIYVAGSKGYICKSIDGGLTFNLCTSAPMLPSSYLGSSVVQDCWSIHFITPLAGVVGMQNNFMMTSDGGVTWNPCCGGNGIEQSSPGFPNPGRIYGIHVDVTSQIVVCTGQNIIARTTNAGTSFSIVYTWASNNGTHLTWETDLRLWAMGIKGERIRSIDGGITWTILNAYSLAGPSHLAAHFYLIDDGFISANTTLLATTDGGLTGLVSDNIPNTITAVWTNYINRNCYLLTDCDGVIPPFIVDNDLGGVIGGTVQVCFRGPDGLVTCHCFTVSAVDSCNEAVTVAVSASFPSCADCKSCYILTDCTDSNNIIVTADNLTQYLGQVIKLEDCPDTCWYVIKSNECPETKCVSPVIEVFETCEDCLPKPIILPVPELNLRRIKPGYYTPGCDPAYTEMVSCTFAQAVYDKMVIDRYGVNMCCNEDVQKWDIKMQLLQLRAIYDPTMCKSTLNNCCPPCDVVAEILTFDPIPCPSPSGAAANFRLIDTCPAPDLANAGIIIPLR